MLAFAESGTAERGRNRLMTWLRGEMSGHNIAHSSRRAEGSPARGDALPVRLMQPLIGAKRLRDGPGPSHSADSPTAALPPKKVRMNEMEIQTSEIIETLDKKDKDWQVLRAKLEEYKAIARERDERKKKLDELQISHKEEEIKHLKDLYMAKVRGRVRSNVP